MHDTFIKIARNIKSIEDPKSDKTLSYVLKATKNTAINLYNKQKKEATITGIQSIDDIPDEQFYERLDISNHYNEVVHAILELDDKYRDVLFYHFVQEMKVSEIADLLSRKKATVKQQLGGYIKSRQLFKKPLCASARQRHLSCACRLHHFRLRRKGG